MPAKSNGPAEPSGFRFSIAGMMLLTAVVAAHLAIGRWEIQVVGAIAPLTLSVTAIETLRRLFRVRFMGALVGGILLGAVMYSLTVGIIFFWDRWLDFNEPEMIRQYGAPSVGRVAYWTARQEFYQAMVYYLILGILVMLVYAAVVIVRDRRAARRKLLQARELRAAVTNAEERSGDG